MKLLLKIKDITTFNHISQLLYFNAHLISKYQVSNKHKLEITIIENFIKKIIENMFYLILSNNLSCN